MVGKSCVLLDGARSVEEYQAGSVHGHSPAREPRDQPASHSPGETETLAGTVSQLPGARSEIRTRRGWDGM